MDSNPIFRFELIRTARQRRHYAMRAVLGLLLLYVAWMLYAFWDQAAVMAGGPERARILRHLPRVADLIVLGMVWSQAVAILVLVPGLVAGSIAEEDRRGTMLALLASPMSSGSIVLGKLAARLAHVGVAVAIGLPVVVPLGLLGALDPAVVARAYAMLLALALFVGSLSLLVSAVVRTGRRALLWSYIAMGSWLLSPAWFAPLAGRAGGPISWLQALADGVRQSHPLEAAMSLWQVPMSEIFYPPGVAWAWSGVSRALPRAVGIQLTGSMLFLVLASRLLRPRRLEASRRRGREPAAPPRPAVGDDPLLWKERYAHTRLSRRAAGMVIALLVVLVVYPLIEPAAASFREWRASWWDDNTTGLGARSSLNQSLRQLNAGLYLIGLAAIAAMAATSVSGERERGTWTSLAMTLVTGREVARARVSGALWAVRGLVIPFAILWVIGLATGSVHPIGVLASAVGLIIFARYGAAIGVLCSMASRTSGRAIVATSLALLVSNVIGLMFVPIDLIGSLAGTWQTVYLAGVSPFVEWISLASPVEIRWSFDGRTWEEAIRLPGGLWGARVALDPGLIRTYLVSLVFHAVGASAAMRAAAWVFDRDRS